MCNFSLLVLGLVICALGIINIKGNITTIHFYNRQRVQEEDVPKYGKAVGTGTLIMGLSLIVSAFLKDEILPFIIIPCFIVGLIFILYGQFKYNKGIF